MNVQKNVMIINITTNKQILAKNAMFIFLIKKLMTVL